MGFAGCTNNLHAESLGLLHDLKLALAEEVRKVICFCDSMETLELFSRTPPQFHRYEALLWDIFDQLHKDWVAVLKQTYKEANQCIDLLA